MNGRASAANAVWRARRIRTAGDRAFLAYLVFMISVVVAAPLARAVWLGMTSPDGIALLTSPDAPRVIPLVVAALWSGALMLGRDRGPALLPPFIAYALASSDIPRIEAFRSPVLRAGALVTSVTTAVTGLIGASLAAGGFIAPPTAVLLTAAGALVGSITAVLWLAGQSLPRVAMPAALSILALSILAFVIPAVQHLTPWGWVGVIYSGDDALNALVALAALTAGLLSAVPAMLGRLTVGRLVAQSVRWESATTHAAGFDLGAVATAYQRLPHVGRRLRPVRPGGRHPAMFLVRDALGAARTPGRLIVGILAVGAGGALTVLAFLPGAPGWMLGAAAGLTLFAGLGPLTDGIRHAANVAADLPLYGISDERLLASHALFPLIVTATVLLTIAVLFGALSGLGIIVPTLSSVVLGVLGVIARVSNALKGHLPPALLTPIPSPMGDLGAAVRLVWAMDAVLLSACAGVAAVSMVTSPVLLVGVTAVLLGVCASRWRQRR